MVQHQLIIYCAIFGIFAPQMLLMESAEALLSPDEQQYCATFNNNLRRVVATGLQKNKLSTRNLPSAANMLQMSYNVTIGQTAQAWANQCKFVHSNTPGLGENIYYTTQKGITNTEALNKAFSFWWVEVEKIGIPQNLIVDGNNFAPIGHFSQMAWHSSADIGCAVATCPNSQWYKFVVCNYWPPGNILGEAIYKSGATCSACDRGWKCDRGRRGLCVRGTAD